jgi:hypothetical protein
MQPQAFTPVTNPVIDSSNPLGEGKILNAPTNRGEGKVEVDGMPVNDNCGSDHAGMGMTDHMM